MGYYHVDFIHESPAARPIIWSGHFLCGNFDLANLAIEPLTGLYEPVSRLGTDKYGVQIQPVWEAMTALVALASDCGYRHLQLIRQPSIGDEYRRCAMWIQRAVRCSVVVGIGSCR